MISKAFFLINIQNNLQPGFHWHPEDELPKMSGVLKFEEVSGIYDYLLEISTQGKISEVADSLMSKPWVKRLHILRAVQPVDPVILSYGNNPSPSAEEDGLTLA